MGAVNSFLDACKHSVQRIMNVLARMLNDVSGGRISPNAITITGFMAHLPIAWLIAYGKNELAFLLLIVFGLFDALDGALARLQKRSGASGMLLDSVTDRMKEIILYLGVTLAFIHTGHYFATIWVVAACGSSLLVSYVNAWGEVVLRGHSNHTVNQSFRSGLMRFEVRMAVLSLGLITDRLIIAVAIIAILSSLTALSRLKDVAAQARHV